MVRTQIYLDQALKKEPSRESHHRRVTVSDLVRQTIEEFLKKIHPNSRKV